MGKFIASGSSLVRPTPVLAVEKVIGTKVKIKVALKVYTNQQGYTDERGNDTLDQIRVLLEKALLPKAA